METSKILRQPRYCSIQSCINSKGTTSDQFHFFKPSMEKHLLEKWKKAIGHHQNVKNIAFVCNLHFESKSMIEMDGQLFLKHGSIPSIFGNIHSPTVIENSSMINQNEDVAVKIEPIDSSDTVKLVNINQIIQNTPSLYNEPVKINQSKDIHEVSSTICIGCEKRDDRIQSLLNNLNKLKRAHEQKIKLIRYWKSLAMYYKCGSKPPLVVKVDKFHHAATKKRSKPVQIPTESTVISTKLNKNKEQPIDVVIASEPATTLELNDVEEIDIKVNETSIQMQDPILKPYKCGKCNEPFENAKQLSHHFRIHNKAFPKCVVCGDNSVDIELDQHLCVQEEFMSCEYCSQTFTSTKRLLVHLDDDHSEEKKHRCSTCKLSFGMRFLKIIHEKSHNVIKPFKCDICSKSYVLQDSLIRHQQKEHTNPEESKCSPTAELGHLCHKCGKEFLTQTKLMVHLRIHRERTIKCPDCPQIFHHNAGLRRHSYLHRNECKFICSTCGKELTSPDGLREHMKSQHSSNTETVECKICSKIFKSKKNLRKHKRIHSITKYFPCSYCNNTYKHSGDLNKHLKTHLGEKIYECKEKGCGERFRLIIELQKHSFVHYKEQQTANTTITED